MERTTATESVVTASRVREEALRILYFTGESQGYEVLEHFPDDVQTSSSNFYRAMQTLGDAGLVDIRKPNDRVTYYTLSDEGRHTVEALDLDTPPASVMTDITTMLPDSSPLTAYPRLNDLFGIDGEGEIHVKTAASDDDAQTLLIFLLKQQVLNALGETDQETPTRDEALEALGGREKKGGDSWLKLDYPKRELIGNDYVKSGSLELRMENLESALEWVLDDA